MRPDALRNAIEGELQDHQAKLIRARNQLQRKVDDAEAFWLDFINIFSGKTTKYYIISHWSINEHQLGQSLTN